MNLPRSTIAPIDAWMRVRPAIVAAALLALTLPAIVQAQGAVDLAVTEPHRLGPLVVGESVRADAFAFLGQPKRSFTSGDRTSDYFEHDIRVVTAVAAPHRIKMIELSGDFPGPIGNGAKMAMRGPLARERLVAGFGTPTLGSGSDYVVWDRRDLPHPVSTRMMTLRGKMYLFTIEELLPEPEAYVPATAETAPLPTAFTPAQEELYAQLRHGTSAGPGGAALTHESLRGALLQYLANPTPTIPYEFGFQQTALSGVPDDGAWHPTQVARDVFVLKERQQIYAFRHVIECRMKFAEPVPQIDCPK